MGLNPGNTFFVKCPLGSTFALPCFERQYYIESDEYKMFILVFVSFVCVCMCQWVLVRI